MIVNSYKIEPGADLRRAKLQGADLQGADLQGADLRGADLQGAVLPTEVPVVPDIDRAVLRAVDAGGNLCMDSWHACATTHCRAGWAVHLAGKAGYALEGSVGPAVAGALIYAKSRPHKPVPDFYCSDETALQSIRNDAAEG